MQRVELEWKHNFAIPTKEFGAHVYAVEQLLIAIIDGIRHIEPMRADIMFVDSCLPPSAKDNFCSRFENANVPRKISVEFLNRLKTKLD